MWVLVIVAWFVAAPTNEARSVAVGVFPTARECIAVKNDLAKQFKEEAGADVASFGLDCVKVEANTVPDKAKPAKS